MQKYEHFFNWQNFFTFFVVHNAYRPMFKHDLQTITPHLPRRRMQRPKVETDVFFTLFRALPGIFCSLVGVFSPGSRPSPSIRAASRPSLPATCESPLRPPYEVLSQPL